MKTFLLALGFSTFLLSTAQASSTFEETVSNIVSGSPAGKFSSGGFILEIVRTDEEMCEFSYKFDDIGNPDLKGTIGVFLNNIQEITFTENDINYGDFSSAVIKGEKNVVGIQYHGDVNVDWRTEFTVLRPLNADLSEVISYDDWRRNWTDLIQSCKLRIKITEGFNLFE